MALGFFIAATVVMLVSMCGKDGLPSQGQSGGNEPEEEKDDTLYISGIEYPEGYDWSKDEEYGTVACSLFLEKNGERILEIPVGHFYEVASDPDMHRCINGHLYTDYSSDTETVVRRDGEMLFRYPGRELMLAFHVSGDGSVYTVGQGRSGDTGFRLRKDGNILLDIGRGSLISDIEEADGKVFLFYRSCENDDFEGLSAQCHMYSSGTVSDICMDEDLENILCATQNKGNICYVATVENDNSAFVYVENGERHIVRTDEYGHLFRCWILKDSDAVYLAGFCKSAKDGQGCRYVVWNTSGEVLYSLEKDVFPFYSFVHEGSFYDFKAAASAFSEMTCLKNGTEIYSYGHDMTFYGSVPAVMSDDVLYFIFSGSSDSKIPCMAKGNKVSEFDFNGYFSSITAW